MASQLFVHRLFSGGALQSLTKARAALPSTAMLPALMLLLARSACAQVQTLSLDGSAWQFRQVALPAERATENAASPAVRVEGDSGWHPAEVPGDVHLDLLRQKLIPEPFFGLNERRLAWISAASWEYRRTVEVPASLADRHRVELVFHGLDTFAQVYVNGKQVLTADNQFRTWRVDVKGNLHAGANELRVVFPVQDAAAEVLARKDSWFPRNTVEAKTYIRKAAYEHGWDWGPEFVTSGIWQPVAIEGWNVARVADFHVKQSDVSAVTAHLTAQVDVDATCDAVATLEMTVDSPAGAGRVSSTKQTMHLHAGENHLELPLDVAHPALWYPAGYGTQPLYRFTVTLHVPEGDEQRTVRTGLRSLELRREIDRWGKSFEFVINGIPIYAKGADVIPSDSFYNRVTPEKYRAMLQSAKDANMNMVRLWGGGYYENEVFYELCDELGILIWHDFMFGNDWQPGSYRFEQNVAHEAEDQLRRLRNHPSIALWSGNNETEEAFHWKDRDKLDPAVRLQMWQDYLTLFHGVLARSVARFDPEVPYWPSSPSSDLEPTSPAYESGDQHIWDVWHGRVPFSMYETHHARFVSEYGFQSFPELRTVESFTTPEDRTSIFTPVMLSHQKNNEGNELIRVYLLRDYPEPKDFPSFLYVSQVLQAEGMKIGAEHLRRERPRNMGSIFWQLNDCWPVASWSSIDSLGRWKALQFYAKRFYAPVLVSPHVEDGRLAVYAVSDRTEPRTGILKVEHIRLDGTVLSTHTQQVTVPALASTVLFQRPLTELSKESRGTLADDFIFTTLQVAGEAESRNLIYLVPTKQITLPAAKVTATARAAAGGFDVEVHSDALARSTYLTSADTAAVFDDNFFDLLPGETRTVHVTSSVSAESFRSGLFVRSLADAFPMMTITNH